MARTVRVLLLGFGRVGSAFAALVEERRADLRLRQGLDVRIVGIATSRAAWRGEGPSVGGLLEQVRGGVAFEALPGVACGWDGRRSIEAIDADVVVEAVAAGLADGEPSLTHLRVALGQGRHVATATKAALVRHYAALRALARQNGVHLRFGAATAAALPTVDFARACLAGATIERIEGVLNGTTNFILTRMARAGLAYAEALAEAQRLGIAEPDPSLDVGGWDTACKLVLMANDVWDAGLTLDDVEVEGIAAVSSPDLADAARAGRALKLVGRLERGSDGIAASVGPTALALDHPLGRLEGSEKGVTFWTDTLGQITVSGGQSAPRGAAAALLRDVVHIFTGPWDGPGPEG
jgi:homoserine dehydrogenase